MNRLGVVALSLLGLAACGDEASEGGSGTLEVRVYGEEFIEQGIPATAVGDGWAVDFTFFEVNIRDVVVAGEALPVASPVELSMASGGEGQAIGSLEVPTGSYGDGSFTIASIRVTGSASKGDQTKSFDWTFNQPVNYHACETTSVVSKNESAVFQITLHADHLLYDSLVSEEPELAFGAFAAADTGDNVITWQELEAAGIGGFDPGNEEIDDLWGWLNGLVRTLGHVDGEGHCHAESAT